MQFSWTKVKDTLLNLTTSNKLTEAEAKAIETAIESDATGATADTTTPVVSSAEEPTIPAPVAQAAAQPTAPALVPVAAAAPASESDELAKLRTENARLKAQITPALAAAIPSEDLTQTGNSTTAENAPNAYYADLKRIKSKFNRFGLTTDIQLGDEMN